MSEQEQGTVPREDGEESLATPAENTEAPSILAAVGDALTKFRTDVFEPALNELHRRIDSIQWGNQTADPERERVADEPPVDSAGNPTR